MRWWGWEHGGVAHAVVGVGVQPRPGHEPQLVHPLLLAPLVLEPDLDHTHRQTSVPRQLLPHGSGGFGVLVENIPQHLELLGFDRGPGAAPLPVLALLLLVILLLLLVLGLPVRLLRGLWLVLVLAVPGLRAE